jgi:hypothetical protein
MMIGHSPLLPAPDLIKLADSLFPGILKQVPSAYLPDYLIRNILRAPSSVAGKSLSIIAGIGVLDVVNGSPHFTPIVHHIHGDCTAIAKARFEVCKSCPDSPDGFNCKLVDGCCFGKRRTDPSFHCPKGAW